MNELRYKLQVEPAMREALAQLEHDASNHGIDKEEFDRAISDWWIERLSKE